jgi:hypothetical protein
MITAAFAWELAEDSRKRAGDSFNNYYVLYNNSSGTNISKWGEYNEVEGNAKYSTAKCKKAVQGGIGNCTCCLDTPVGGGGDCERRTQIPTFHSPQQPTIPLLFVRQSSAEEQLES